MCGYCFETGFVLPFVESEMKQEAFDLLNNEIGIHQFLQETSNLPLMVQQTHLEGLYRHSLDILFCRLYEQYLTEPFDASYFSMIRSTFGWAVVETFLAGLKTRHAGQLWQALGDENLYTTESQWRSFMAVPQMLTAAQKQLQAYHDWWLLGRSKQFSDPVQRFEATGMYDPIHDTTPKDWRTFQATFPVIFFAFITLAHHQPQAAILKQIALQIPHGVPDFNANDLWLQRRALITCIRHYGVAFLIENLHTMRYELIHYALMKHTLNREDLERLKTTLTSRLHVNSEASLEELMTLIEQLQAQRA